MVGREYTAVLDPFSRDGKKIAQKAPPFDSFPQEIVEQAVERARHRSGREATVGFDEDAVRADVLSFYLMCQGVASVSYPYSNEARLVTDATRDTIRYRMFDLFNRGHEDLCLAAVKHSFKLIKLEREDGIKLGDTEIPKGDIYKLRDKSLEKIGVDVEKEVVDDRKLLRHTPSYALRWTDFAPLLKHRRADLTKLYIVNGWAVITPRELWGFFADYVGARTEEYISSLCEQFSERGLPSEMLSEVGGRISQLVPPEMARRRFAPGPRGKLRPEAFPPCVQMALNGVGSGARNYAITILLTSFLSYARVSPSGKAISRISDFINDISVINDEVMPLISEAAEKCKPPFFRDQPQEKANVYYHMGFGMTTDPRMTDSGKSKWYRTPNCRKVKTAAPPLCNPDELCAKLKNPLTYYYRKLSELAKSGGK